MTNDREQVLLDRIEQVRRYAKTTQFHSREDCTELVPVNGRNLCNCGLRTMQVKFDYILDILDGVEERDRYRYRGDPPWLPPRADDVKEPCPGECTDGWIITNPEWSLGDLPYRERCPYVGDSDFTHAHPTFEELR